MCMYTHLPQYCRFFENSFSNASMNIILNNIQYYNHVQLLFYYSLWIHFLYFFIYLLFLWLSFLLFIENSSCLIFSSQSWELFDLLNWVLRFFDYFFFPEDFSWENFYVLFVLMSGVDFLCKLCVWNSRGFKVEGARKLIKFYFKNFVFYKSRTLKFFQSPKISHTIPKFQQIPHFFSYPKIFVWTNVKCYVWLNALPWMFYLTRNILFCLNLINFFIFLSWLFDLKLKFFQLINFEYTVSKFENFRLS